TPQIVQLSLHDALPIFDGVGRVEERLAALELVDGSAARAQFHNLVADLDDVGEPDALKTPREAKDGSGRGQARCEPPEICGERRSEEHTSELQSHLNLV